MRAAASAHTASHLHRLGGTTPCLQASSPDSIVIVSEMFIIVWGCWSFPEHCPKSGIQKYAAITYNVRWISKLTNILRETQSDSSPFPTGLCILTPPKLHDLWPSLLYLSRLSWRSACNQSFFSCLLRHLILLKTKNLTCQIFFPSAPHIAHIYSQHLESV